MEGGMERERERWSEGEGKTDNQSSAAEFLLSTRAHPERRPTGC